MYTSYAEISRLSNKHPEVLQHFLLQGEFSVQIGVNNPFGMIHMDQSIEEAANRDANVTGGIRNYSLKFGGVS